MDICSTPLLPTSKGLSFFSWHFFLCCCRVRLSVRCIHDATIRLKQPVSLPLNLTLVELFELAACRSPVRSRTRDLQRLPESHNHYSTCYLLAESLQDFFSYSSLAPINFWFQPIFSQKNQKISDLHIVFIGHTNLKSHQQHSLKAHHCSIEAEIWTSFQKLIEERDGLNALFHTKKFLPLFRSFSMLLNF